MSEFKTLSIHHGSLKFSAGHFTIFSATEREKMHGHNFYLEAHFTAPLDKAGITFDYRLIKMRLKKLCEQLNTYFLLPTLSPYLHIEQDDDYVRATFNHKTLFFLKEDVMLLPIRNITVEELSQWFVDQVMSDKKFVEDYQIKDVSIHVYNGLEQSACSQWLSNPSD